ncbi:prephenate dehydratase [Methylobrevis albus]|uniref:prephenate dehydratase n=1 Tax=Methylobrevis albus TaxID=2793297 RepID=A0A931MWN2_9HYPH|nr:prephenate dehydratase [Methylobrevis albus]MBH0237428.1 prephenate dehydratase [Methylobrevis albus]
MNNRLRVAFQGERGANSEIASLDVYPDAEPVPCPTFEDCFAAVQSGAVDLAMIPIENSLAGRVADIHHLLPDSGLNIVGEYFLPIHFHLMAPRGATLGGLKSVESHVHALGQCRRIIRKYGLTPVVAGDTAGAARLVSEANDLTRSALAPVRAASIYGLDILARDVEDAAHNTTRFVILSPTPANASAGNGPVITTFVFRVRNIPAALYKGLGGFATNGINMTKLESYQLEGQFFATQFYADVEGHPDEPGLRRALEELAFFSAELRILGVYPASPFREKLRESVPAE